MGRAGAGRGHVGVVGGQLEGEAGSDDGCQVERPGDPASARRGRRPRLRRRPRPVRRRSGPAGADPGPGARGLRLPRGAAFGSRCGAGGGHTSALGRPTPSWISTCYRGEGLLPSLASRPRGRATRPGTSTRPTTRPSRRPTRPGPLRPCVPSMGDQPSRSRAGAMMTTSSTAAGAGTAIGDTRGAARQRGPPASAGGGRSSVSAVVVVAAGAAWAVVASSATRLPGQEITGQALGPQQVANRCSRPSRLRTRATT